MVAVNFTTLRQNATKYFDAVERGETIRVIRHGKVIAEIRPPSVQKSILKTKIPKLVLPGIDVAKLIREERDSGL